jgi:hypothetical protein
MIMGQAAGSAAVLAIKSGVDVQRVDIASLHAVLRANGVIFRPPPAPPGAAASPSASTTAGSTMTSTAAASSRPLPSIPGPARSTSDSGPFARLVAVEGGLAVVFVVVFVAMARARRRRSPSA